MNRRNFLNALLGTAAATALPSEIWPFRKIFLPVAPQIVIPEWDELMPVGLFAEADMTYLAQIEAVQLEALAKAIPDLISKERSLYNLFKKDAIEIVS